MFHCSTKQFFCQGVTFFHLAICTNVRQPTQGFFCHAVLSFCRADSEPRCKKAYLISESTRCCCAARVSVKYAHIGMPPAAEQNSPQLDALCMVAKPRQCCVAAGSLARLIKSECVESPAPRFGNRVIASSFARLPSVACGNNFGAALRCF